MQRPRGRLPFVSGLSKALKVAVSTSMKPATSSLRPGRVKLTSPSWGGLKKTTSGSIRLRGSMTHLVVPSGWFTLVHQCKDNCLFLL